MTLIRRYIKSFAFEDVSQMTSTSCAGDLSPRREETFVLVSVDCTRDSIVESGPPAPRVELRSTRVQRGPTTCAGIYAIVLMFLVLAHTGSLCSLLAEDPELFWGKLSAPLILGFGDSTHGSSKGLCRRLEVYLLMRGRKGEGVFMLSNSATGDADASDH